MPTSDPYWRVKELFVEALDKSPGEQREAFLRGACGEDAELLLRINEMLGAHARASAVLSPPGHAPVIGLAGTVHSDTIAAAPSERAGEMIGPYKLLERIGEGGMGAVWMAEQREPIRRTVALKLIKLGMDTRSVIARFEAERQALALMDHPNIARVFDAGSTDSGRPYFAMELVKGVPITQYCDEHRLSVRQRLELFAQVCAAVQHAHQKGLIHRDLKPSNVLVATHDGDRPAAKVIDFGIAKATQARLTEKTLFTEFRQLIGTPEYMSPEQAVGDLDTDTRSDVYALGVLLYELLVGTTPFDGRELRSKAYAEMQRIIREVEPPRPSTRLSSLATLPAVAARRGTEPARLGASVRGELDWIVMKCLEKDRARRYATANGLAADVQRYLADEPVSAAAPSRAYRLRKFARRNKTTVVVSLAMVLLLLGGVVGTTIGLIGQSRQRARAEANEAEARRQKAQAEQARDEVQAVNDFLAQDVLRGAGPSQLPDKSIRDQIVKAMIDPAAATVAVRFKEKPFLEAAVRTALAGTYDSLGRGDLALPHAERARKICRELLGDAHPNTLRTTALVGHVLKSLGKLDAAEQHLREGFERQRRVLGDDHFDTLNSMNDLADVLFRRGKLDQSEPLAREALERSRRVLGNDHALTITTLSNMAYVLNTQGKHGEAEPLFREAMDASRRVFGPDHPQTLLQLNNMGYALQSQGKLDEAEALLDEGLRRSRAVLGGDHYVTMSLITNVGTLMRAQQKLDQSELLMREGLERCRRVLGDDHPQTLNAINNLGILLRTQEKLDEAEPLLREAMERCRRILGNEHPNTLTAIANMGNLLHLYGKFDQAETLLREALAGYERKLGSDHPSSAVTRASLGIALAALNRRPEAETELLSAERVLAAAGAGRERHQRCVQALADLYDAWDKSEPGKGYDAKAIEWRVKLPATRGAAATSPSTPPATSRTTDR